MVLDHRNSGYYFHAKLHTKWLFISIKYLLLISIMNSICQIESEVSLCLSNTLNKRLQVTIKMMHF